MAELNLGKGLTAGKVASNVQKKLTRAQEKVRCAPTPGCVKDTWGITVLRPLTRLGVTLPHPPLTRRVASRHHKKSRDYVFVDVPLKCALPLDTLSAETVY